MYNNHPKRIGERTVLSKEEEKSVVGHIMSMADYGFPVNALDIRCIVKEYLEKLECQIKCFKENFLGKPWFEPFMARNKTLSKRIAKNITNSRPAIGQQIIVFFFAQFLTELQDIPRINTWNYDEANLIDDPRSTKIIARGYRILREDSKFIKNVNLHYGLQKCCRGSRAGSTVRLVYVSHAANYEKTRWLESPWHRECNYILVEFKSNFGRKRDIMKYYIGGVLEILETENYPQWYCTLYIGKKIDSTFLIAF